MMYLFWKSLGFDFGRVQVVAVGFLVVALMGCGVIELYDDLASYPPNLQARAHGGILFYPLFCTYLFSAFVYFVMEQRRQLKNFAARLHLAATDAESYVTAIGKIAPRHAVMITVGSILGGLAYMWMFDLVRLDQLTAAQNWRRLGLIILPLLMIMQLVEIIILLIVSNSIMLRFEEKYAPSYSYRPIDLHGLSRFFLNQLTFAAFSLSLMPVMWFGGAVPWYDVAVIASYMIVFYGCALFAARRIRYRIKDRMKLDLPVPIASERVAYSRFDPMMDSAVMRLMAEYLSGVKRETILSRSAVTQFFFFLTPIPLWGVVYFLFVWL